MTRNWDLENELESELSKLRTYVNNGWWIDETDKDYIICNVSTSARITDRECISIAKRIKKFIVKNNLTVKSIYTGPFFFPIDSKHLS